MGAFFDLGLRLAGGISHLVRDHLRKRGFVLSKGFTE
jgi:hypothetical protein